MHLENDFDMPALIQLAAEGEEAIERGQFLHNTNREAEALPYALKALGVAHDITRMVMGEEAYQAFSEQLTEYVGHAMPTPQQQVFDEFLQELQKGDN